MKDKFTIFSPQCSKADTSDRGTAFKKSPNKFAVCEPFIKPREQSNFLGNQALSSKRM